MSASYPVERIVVRPPASPEEYRRACRFTTERYRAAGYLAHDKTFAHPGALLLAVRGDELIGSMGVVSGDTARLPSERAFGFRVEDVVDASRASIFEASRVATARGSDVATFQGLVAAAFSYSRRLSERPVWLFTVTRTHEILMRRYLFHPERLPYAVARPSLRRDFPAYWGAEPPPFAVYVGPDAIDRALTRLLPELEAKILFRHESFDHHADVNAENTRTTRAAGRARP